ncbi:MAG: 50S ribosomal protein L9 [Gammaproteobacteria bacterium RIFCSPHIGHO2_12_FULL_37_34]|nr:MAG: 50S ribosomal protein L9 [Gammaproteobacteria bacterium RIFCSPHIGHO2_12_FULL_37_34]
MEIILLEKIRHLGDLGEKVRVKPGFARNYLIPKNKAVYATQANIIRFEERRAELERLAAERLAQAIARQQAIQALPAIVITMKASEEGKLFGSVTVRDIVQRISVAGVSIERREINMPEGALRALGEYELTLELDSSVTATIKVSIVAEG